MRSEDREVFLAWKRGLDAHNLVVLEERKNANYRERFQSLIHIWRMASEMGLSGQKTEDLSVNDTWQRLRRAYFQRHA